MKIAHPLGQAVLLQLEKAAASAQNVDDLYDAAAGIDPGPFALDNQMVRPQQTPTRHPLMLVGKTPAATEIQTGLPLQGPAGQMLRNAVRDAGIDLAACHYTHASPWRARKDNTPSPTQIAMSRPLLMREIELVEPRCIIILGAKAADGMFEEHPTMSEDLHYQSMWHGKPVHIIRSHGFILRHRQHYDSYVDTWKDIVKSIGEPLKHAA